MKGSHKQRNFKEVKGVLLTPITDLHCSASSPSAKTLVPSDYAEEAGGGSLEKDGTSEREYRHHVTTEPLGPQMHYPGPYYIPKTKDRAENRRGLQFYEGD